MHVIGHCEIDKLVCHALRQINMWQHIVRYTNLCVVLCKTDKPVCNACVFLHRSCVVHCETDKQYNMHCKDVNLCVIHCETDNSVQCKLITCLSLNVWHTGLCMSQCPITCLSVSMRGTQIYLSHNALSHVYVSQCMAYRFIYLTMCYQMFICLNAWHTSLPIFKCTISCLSVSMRGTQV